MSQKLILCAAESRSQANRIVGHLINAGIAHNSVSVLFPQVSGSGDEMGQKFSISLPAKAGIGALLGGAFIWLTGVGVLSAPGIGSLIIAGAPLITAMGRTLRGGLSGALAGIGISQTDAISFEESIKRGNILISVDAAETMEMMAAKKIMQALGAHNIAIAGDEMIPSMMPRVEMLGAALT